MMGELHQYPAQGGRLRAKACSRSSTWPTPPTAVTSGYSGGMRRRLDLAATLVADPEVLFLDEPTTGLDPRARTELWSVLDHLVDRGTTLLLTTQYLDEAERLADDIIVIDHGRIIARGDARKLKREVGGDNIAGHRRRSVPAGRRRRLLAEVTGPSPGSTVRARRVTAPTSRRRGRAGRGGQGAGGGGDRRRRPEPAPADPGRGVPAPHRGRPRGRRDEDGPVVTATTVTDVQRPVTPHRRPRRVRRRRGAQGRVPRHVGRSPSGASST